MWVRQSLYAFDSVNKSHFLLKFCCNKMYQSLDVEFCLFVCFLTKSVSCFKDGKLFWLVWLEESRAEVADLEVHSQIPATEGAIEAIFLLLYFVGLTFVTHTEVVYRGLRFFFIYIISRHLGILHV